MQSQWLTLQFFHQYLFFSLAAQLSNCDAPACRASALSSSSESFWSLSRTLSTFTRMISTTCRPQPQKDMRQERTTLNTCCNSIVFWLFEMLYEVNCTTHLHAALCIYNAFIFWSMNSLHTNTHSPHPLVLVSAAVGGCWWCLEVEQEDRLLQEHLLDWHHLQQTWTSKENHDTLKKVTDSCTSYGLMFQLQYVKHRVWLLKRKKKTVILMVKDCKNATVKTY